MYKFKKELGGVMYVAPIINSTYMPSATQNAYNATGVTSVEVKSDREILSDKVQHEAKVPSGVQSEATAPA